MLVDLVIDALIGPMSESARREIKKTLERAAIKAFCAPPIKSGRKGIVDKCDEEIGVLAMTNKTAVTTLAAQMDSSINGLGQKAISEAVSKNSTSFEDLTPKKKNSVLTMPYSFSISPSNYFSKYSSSKSSSDGFLISY